MWSFGKLGLVIRGFRERAGWGGCLLRRDKLFIRFLGGERGGGGVCVSDGGSGIGHLVLSLGGRVLLVWNRVEVSVRWNLGFPLFLI